MIRSMTGFARREVSGPWGSLAWELRTVNHRYLEIACRLPEEFRAAEGEFRRVIGVAVRRGKVDCTLNFRAAAGAGSALEIDRTLLAALVERAREVARLAQTNVDLDPLELLRWPGVVSDEGRDLAPALAAAQAALEQALVDLTRMRASEGERIRELLDQRCVALLAVVESVATRLPEVHNRIRARLLERVAQLQAQPDNDRF